MKHWLNNWEKVFGKRLRNARTKPDSHVWDLIEQELDMEAQVRSRKAKRLVAALIIFLLLGSAGGYVYTSSSFESGVAQDYELQFPYSSQWVISPDGINASDNNLLPGQNRTVRGDITDVMVRSEAAEIADQDDEAVAELKSAVDILATDESVNPSIEAAVKADMIQRIIAANSVMLEHQKTEQQRIREEANSAVDRDFDEAALNKLADQILVAGLSPHKPINLINLKGIAQVGKEAITLSDQGVTNFQELLNRIAQHTSVESKLLVSNPAADQGDIHVHQNVHSLTGHLDEGRLAASDHSDLSQSDLAYTETAYKHNETALVQEIIEELAVVESVMNAESMWMEEVMSELESWKASLEEQELSQESSEEIQKLVDKAQIDEEDPLTKRQMETKDLYRAHNINKGFHIGMISGFQTSWVTRASRNPEVDRSVASYKFKPGYQVGLNMGYDFTNHFGLMAEFKYSSEGGKYYHPIKERDQSIDLRYLEIPIYAKVKHSKMTQKMRPIVFNYLLGFTYSDLKKVEMLDGDVDKRFGQDYNTSEWGISAGFDFDFYINKNFFWTVGTRAGVSGNARSFPRFKSESGEGAMSVDAGIYTRLNFRLPGK